MGPSEYIKILKKNILFILAVAIFGSLCGYFASTKIPSGFRLSQTFFLATQNQSDQYGGYYNQEKARNFTDTEIGLISGLDVSRETGITGASVEVIKQAPQLIKVTVTSKDRLKAQRVISKIAPTINEMTQKFQSISDITLIPVGSSPQTEFSAPGKIILITVGFLLGLISSLLVVFLKIFFEV